MEAIKKQVEDQSINELSLQNFNSLINSIIDSIAILDEEGIIVSWNQSAESIFGYSQSQILGESIFQVIHSKLWVNIDNGMEREFSVDIKAIEGKTIELIGRKSNDTEFPVEVSLSSFHLDGKAFNCAIIRDISAREIVEEEIKRTLVENKLSLMDAQNRARSNTQFIKSLLSYYSSKTSSKEAMNSYKECQKKVISLSFVHDKLLQTADSNSIFLDKYIGALCYYYQKQILDRSGVSIKMNLSPISICREKAIPCAMIISELINNLCQLAFEENKRNVITIDLNLINEGEQVSLKMGRLTNSGAKNQDRLDLETNLLNEFLIQLEGKLSPMNEGLVSLVFPVA